MRKKQDFPWILNKLEWEETGCFVERRYKRVEIRDLKAETFEGPRSSVLLLSGRYYSTPVCPLFVTFGRNYKRKETGMR